MGRIKRMSETLANKIAAGEVVERPASIVKELVENALDAGARHIQVEVEEAGLSKIKIVDDGHGFESDDCELAFERHATSKITNERDLFQIRTLGFRGEALPSIAAVSHLELTTGTGNGPGTKVVLEGGEITLSEPAPSRRGTEIIVSNLFYNTPARLKHLKTIHTELANISDMVNKLALANPKVRFTITHNGKIMLRTNGNGDLAQVLAAIYGVETAKRSLPLQAESLDFRVQGRLVKPDITRAGRSYVFLFINGRFIRHYPLFNAIVRGYHTLLPIGRYPIVAIHIEMDPTLIDVNVHPAKLEARISKEKDLCDLVESAVKAAFHQERLIPEITSRPAKPAPSEQQRLDFSIKDEEKESQPRDAQVIHESPDRPYKRDDEMETASSYLPTDASNDQVHQPDEEPMERETADAPDLTETEVHVSDTIRTETEQPYEKKRMPTLYPVGQIHGTYIVAQNEDGMYLIDQHAAQERIKYEFYREKVAETEQEVQELLFPITFDFTAAEKAIIEYYREFLAGIGLNFEPFGGHSYIVRSHPRWFPKNREKETVEDIVEELLQEGKVSVKTLREDLAIMMSCKKSIKANRHLRADEIKALLDQLAKADDPFTCPHGRPVIIHFSSYELEKMFKRVM